MRYLIFPFAIVGMALFTGCGSAPNVNTARLTNTAADAVNTVANAVGTATSTGPEGFLKNAAQGGNAEVEMGKLASTKATNPEVKKFAQMMVTEHTAAHKELEDVAKKKNITLPTDTGDKPRFDKLSAMSGSDFDRYYVEQMVEDHKSTLDAFKKQAESGSDADVKAFAAKSIPVLQKHFDAIKAIQAKIK